MIKIFTAEKVKELDQYTILHEPVTSIALVERASITFVNEFCRHYLKSKHVVVFAGPGNNGADALAIARLLHHHGYRVEAFSFNLAQRLSAECEINKQRLIEEGNVRLTEITGESLLPALSEHNVVIDGLFGSGLNRQLCGSYATVIRHINQSKACVVAIDIPSGLFGEDNHSNDKTAIIQADYTFTFEFPKLAFVLPENAIYVGKWKVLHIGIHPDIIKNSKTPYQMVMRDDVSAMIKRRNTFDHKGTFGHALLIGGSKGKMGAAVLSATACLRAGAGRLTVHIPERGEVILQTTIPEAMVSLDSNRDVVAHLPTIEHADAIAIGPGLDTQDESRQVLETLLKQATQPLLIDADGLNLIAAHRELLAHLLPRTIMTPHPKEFERLFGTCESGYERLQRAYAAAIKYQLIIVLKGAYTAICTPQGDVFINSTGNPGMATAGSGDVLTGIILALLAQGYQPEIAAVLGVYLHGEAGDLALMHHAEESLIAGDIIAMLGKAFKTHKRQ